MALAKSRFSNDAGFSLMEVLIAMGVMTWPGRARAAVRALDAREPASKTTTFAAMLAQQKMEQLRGLTWGFDTVGLPISDVSTNMQRRAAARRLPGVVRAVRAPACRRRPGARSAERLRAGSITSITTAASLGGGATPSRTGSTSGAGRWSRCRPTRTTRLSFRCSSPAASIAVRPTRATSCGCPKRRA